MASSFLQTLQAQPWYNDVAQIFAKDNVPAPLWEATVKVEDPSLDPTAVNYGTPQNPEQSHGLFQINLYGDLSGDPSRVAAALGTPQAQAQWAASKMSQAISGMLTAPLPLQLQAIEKAGWPGNLSEDAQRQAALQDVAGTPSLYQWLGVGNPAGANAPAPPAPDTSSIGGAINAFTGTLKSVALNFGFGALGLGLLAAGAVILASNSTAAKDAAKAAVIA